jgi:hypothetical protein
MSFRNDGQIAALHDVFTADLGCRPDFFRTVVFEFENSQGVAMSWRLTSQEVLDLEEGLTRNENSERLKSLVEWWGTSCGASRGDRAAPDERPPGLDCS